MNKIQIINIRYENPFEYDNYVYIGRPSKWGNPFEIGKDGNRKQVIEKYEQYLKNNKYLMSCLDELKGATLGCWCFPLPCHGDILKKLVDGEEIEENDENFEWKSED